MLQLSVQGSRVYTKGTIRYKVAIAIYRLRRHGWWNHPGKSGHGLTNILTFNTYKLFYAQTDTTYIAIAVCWPVGSPSLDVGSRQL